MYTNPYNLVVKGFHGNVKLLLRDSEITDKSYLKCRNIFFGWDCFNGLILHLRKLGKGENKQTLFFFHGQNHFLSFSFLD
jgi:hypothetical protein